MVFKHTLRAFGLFAIVCATSVQAGEWRMLSGPEIEALLDDTRLEYDGAWQEFYKSGKTLYNAGRDSWGNWRVQGNLYCSEWPPNAGWDCYAMTKRREVVRFIDTKGNVSEGTLADLK
ncbi:MAG: hypothetical protein AAGJ34_04040 [Pseudomonadota bacterium]